MTAPVVNSRTFAAPPLAVFAAFVDPTRLARWWGPKGFTNRFETIDFRPGGDWRYTMIGPNGAEYANESRFAEIVPTERIVIRHLSKPRYELVVTLAPAGGGTRLTWTMTFDPPLENDKGRAFITGANEENLDRLAEELARPVASDG